jgi:hypothetical protein
MFFELFSMIFVLFVKGFAYFPLLYLAMWLTSVMTQRHVDVFKYNSSIYSPIYKSYFSLVQIDIRCVFL